MCYSKANHPHWGNHHPRHHAKKWWKHKMQQTWMYPPSNIEEMDDRYEVLIYAAGHDKKDISINLKDNTLIVKANKPTQESAPDLNWQRREFSPQRFSRYFELNDKIDKDRISAQYTDGVLKITLPKLEGKETLRKEIEVL